MSEYQNSAERRRRKFERQRGFCHWCKKPMTLEFGKQPKANGNPSIPANFATFEHLQRRRDGGAGKPFNVVLACRRCNNGRDAGKPLPGNPPAKPENAAARRRSNQELRELLAAGTLTDAERGELYKRGLLPNWPMWSKFMAHVPLGNP